MLEAGNFTLAYAADTARTAVTVNDRDGAALPLSSGSCTHDGECVVSGCGNHCVAWDVPAVGGTCPAYHALTDAFCGCLTGHCAWFNLARVTLSVLPRVSAQPPRSAHLRSGQDDQNDQPQVIVNERLRSEWLQRQLQRCYQGHLDVLPEKLTVAFWIDARRQVTNHQVSGASPRVSACVSQVFGWLHFPEPRGGAATHDTLAGTHVRGEIEIGVVR
jgi:hypothetical protein